MVSVTLADFETIEYRNPALNLSMICEEEDGEWTGEMPGPEGELLVRLPSSSASAPDEASLKALTWALAHLPELRGEAVGCISKYRGRSGESRMTAHPDAHQRTN